MSDQIQLPKPWRQVVLPAGPWQLQWYGSPANRGYWITEGRECIAFLGTEISSESAQDIVWAHNVSMQKAEGDQG